MIFRKKCVLFDMDGSLVDSMQIWPKIDREFLGRYGQTVPSDLEKEIEGMSFWETAAYFKKRFAIPLSEKEIGDVWNGMAYEKYCKEVDLKPGASEFLRFLKEKGMKTGIATSNSRQLAEAVLSAHGILSEFDAIITGSDSVKGKPAPDIYLLAAEQIGCDPKDCIVFEDVPAGILAGKNAGMTVIAVEDSFSDHLRKEKEALSDWMIRDYRQVITRFTEEEQSAADI